LKRVKWGVIGAGGIADRRTIPGMLLASNAELVSVMDSNSDLVGKIKQKYNVKKQYNNVDDLLKDPEIEAVYIASPVEYHKDQAVKAAKAKKHILIEKPLALSVKDAEEVIDVCSKEGVLVAAGFMMRFGTYNQKMKEIVQSGQIGQVINCAAQFTCWYPDMQNAWRQIKAKSGGGALMDMGVHCIDLIQYITQSKVSRVAALNATKTFKYDVEDMSMLLMELENGAFCNVSSNFNIPDEASRWRIEFYGTKGRIIGDETIGQIDGGNLDIVIVNEQKGYDAQQDKKDVKKVSFDAQFGNMYTREIESFGNSVIDGKPLEVPAEDALFVQRVVEAAYESSITGKFISLK